MDTDDIPLDDMTTQAIAFMLSLHEQYMDPTSDAEEQELVDLTQQKGHPRRLLPSIRSSVIDSVTSTSSTPAAAKPQPRRLPGGPKCGLTKLYLITRPTRPTLQLCR